MVALRRLNRNVPQKELDLLQLAPPKPWRPSTGTSQIGANFATPMRFADSYTVCQAEQEGPSYFAVRSIASGIGERSARSAGLLLMCYCFLITAREFECSEETF